VSSLRRRPLEELAGSGWVAPLGDRALFLLLGYLGILVLEPHDVGLDSREATRITHVGTRCSGDVGCISGVVPSLHLHAAFSDIGFTSSFHRSVVSPTSHLRLVPVSHWLLNGSLPLPADVPRLDGRSLHDVVGHPVVVLEAAGLFGYQAKGPRVQIIAALLAARDVAGSCVSLLGETACPRRGSCSDMAVRYRVVSTLQLLLRIYGVALEGCIRCASVAIGGAVPLGVWRGL